MKYLEDSRLTQLTSDLTGAFLNTRGSGESLPAVASVSGGGNRIKGEDKEEDKDKRDTIAPYLSYSPEGYSTYGSSSPSSSRGGSGGGGHRGGGGTNGSYSSSCRVIYGRVEAYTTKRAGSDKRTAHEVGERYAREMRRLNEAVEEFERKRAERGEEGNDEGEPLDGSSPGGEEGSPEAERRRTAAAAKKIERRRRSRSLDGVTFAAPPEKASSSSSSPTPLEPLREGCSFHEGGASVSKRDHPAPEGILRPSSKRCRAASFDVSTGPSTLARYHRNVSSSSLLASAGWDGRASAGARPAAIEDDLGSSARPLVPQPSLYQSSLGGEQDQSGGLSVGSSVAVAPRRLVTDLILTLNASFPDYDFGSARVSDFRALPAAEAVRNIDARLGEFAATTDRGRDFLPRLWTSLDELLGGLGECEAYSYAPPEGAGAGEDPLEFLTASMAGGQDDGDAAADEEGSGDVVAVVSADRPKGVTFSPANGGRIVSSEDFDLADAVSPMSGGGGGSEPHVTLWSMNYFFVSRNKKRIVLVACVETTRSNSPRADSDGNTEYYGVGEYEGGDYGENDVVFHEARRGMQEEAEKAREYERYDSWPSSRVAADSIGPSMSGGGDESVSVVVEDTDLEEGAEDVDGDMDQDEIDDFDTGALGISVSIPSQVV